MIPMRTAFFTLLLLLSACSKPDPTVILGNWRAESFTLDSLKLPLAPNFEVTRNELILKLPDGRLIRKVALESIKAEGETIQLDFQDGLGVGLVFIVDSRDRVYFKVPLIGTRIAFNRI